MLKSTIEYDKEDLKVIVNDQKLNIIVLDYIEIQNKYEWYLKAFRFFGNFATFEHIAAIFKNQYSRTKVFNDLDNMCEMHLLKKEALGNYIYFVLTKKAQIYLKQRNNVGHISNPSDKAIKNNLLLGNYLLNNRLWLTTEKMRVSDNEISTLISDFSDYEEYTRLCYRNLYNRMNTISGIKSGFLQEQINIISKKSEFIESNGKLRFVRYYDALSKLILKNMYLVDFESNHNDITITFLIQDIERSTSWYKHEILNIESILKDFYFNPIRKCINYDVIIQTDSIDNKKNLVKVQALFNDLKKKGEKYIKDMMEGGLGESTLIDYYLIHRRDLPWGLNNINIVEYNTVRFFENKSDKINNIDHTQVNILELL